MRKTTSHGAYLSAMISDRRVAVTVEQGDWTSLDLAQLAVSALTPLLVLFLTWAVSQRAKRADQAESREAARAAAADRANRRAVDRLVELHKEMAPLINDLYCFFTRVGHFREIDPPTLVTKKRQLDKLYFVNEYLFDVELRRDYQAFMQECFKQFAGAGQDAKIRTSRTQLRRERGNLAEWDGSWDALLGRVSHVERGWGLMLRG